LDSIRKASEQLALIKPQQEIQSFISRAKPEVPFHAPFLAAPESPKAGLAVPDSKSLFSKGESSEKLKKRAPLELKRIEKEVADSLKKQSGIEVLMAIYDQQPQFTDNKNRMDIKEQYEELEQKIQGLLKEKEEWEKLLAGEHQSGTVAEMIEVKSKATGCAKSIRSSKTESSGVSINEDGRPSAALNDEAGGSQQDIKSFKVHLNKQKNAVLYTPVDAASHRPVAIPTPPAIPGPPCPQECAVLLRALYDFEAQESTMELSFRENDTLVLLEKNGEWWKAQDQRGQVGFVPSNYVQAIK
jgi:hypothetical protein